MDSCNFNTPEGNTSSSLPTNKKMCEFFHEPVQHQPTSTPPIAIKKQGTNDASKTDNVLSSWNNNNALSPSPRAPAAAAASPQLGPANSPQRRRDSESSGKKKLPRISLTLSSLSFSFIAFSDISSASAMSSIPPIDEADLATATNQWSSSAILGKGGFGTVYKGNWKNTQVAIKRMENVI